VVEVEQRSLRALEQDAVAAPERLVDEQRRVGDVRSQPLRERLVRRRDLLQLERLVLVHTLEPEVLLHERRLDLLAQDLRVEQVLHADPEPGRLVGVRGPDPAPRRPDLQLPEPPLARAVDRDVPRHDQVRVARDPQRRGGDAAGLEPVDLLQQHLRVDDAAGAEHARLAGEDPGGKVAELERLAVDDDRVPGVRPALVAADDVAVLREQVDDLALPLVAPLRADDHGRGHGGILPDAAGGRVQAARARSCRGDSGCWRRRPREAAPLAETRLHGLVERTDHADRMPAGAARRGVVALEVEPPLDARAEEPVLGGALLAHDGERGRPRRQPDGLVDHARSPFVDPLYQPHVTLPPGP
jgi:hypothetical protein